jgi:hypothetical protein
MKIFEDNCFEIVFNEVVEVPEKFRIHPYPLTRDDGYMSLG